MFEPEETQDILVCAALETHGGSRIEGEPVLDPALERLTKHAVNDTAYQKVHEAVKGCKTPPQLTHKPKSSKVIETLCLLI